MTKQKQKLNLQNTILLILGIIVILFIIINDNVSVEAAQKVAVTYTIKTSSNPYKNQYKTTQTYNDKTKHYYLLRSYLEQMEKDGGGTLIITKGTYVVTNTLYIPSNVTLLLKDGVKLIKGNDTGTTALASSKYLFQLIAPSKSGKTSVAAKYAGESGIKLIGEGTAQIDLNYVKDAIGIVLGHNLDITIKGITFQKMNNGCFIKIGASKEVSIMDNVFQYHKDSDTNSREAIAIEVPDLTTKSFSYPWSKNDLTVSQNITIQNNDFLQLERAIGSSKYTEGKYHKNIQIIDNTITKTDSYAIRILNWEKCVVKKNHLSDITNKESSLKAILISGAKDPTVTENVFRGVDRAIQIMPWKNTNSGNAYKITYNQINSLNKESLLHNTLLDMGEYYLRYNKTYNEFTLDTEKWDISDPSVKAFSVTPTSETFQNAFTNYSTYNSITKQYYMLRSYLEQLEKVGGGTLTLAAGTYEICNSLYVPSHVTLYLEDGVVIKKTEQTGTEALISAKSIFQLAAPSKSKIAGAYGDYNGETDIQFIGKGTAIIDLNYVADAIGIVFGHNSEVSISGITFQNMNSGHFIELDASRDVTIENNSFLNHKASQTGMKEAINIDTPDKNTGGFKEAWTNYDCTPNKDILIQNNTFKDLERAIGTHKYSEGKYHENIQIMNNKIENTTSDAIRIMNWTTPIIKGNEIKHAGTGTDRAILASGVIHPVITGNSIMDTPRAIQIMPWKNSNGTGINSNIGGGQYAITYNTINENDISLMLQNSLTGVGENFIRINYTYDVFTSDTKKYYFTSKYVQ
jgi:hypothetical protein